jgi:hypothetical protein
MTIATRDAILAARDWKCQDIHVPSWGTIRIREFSAAEYTRFAKDFSEASAEDADAIRVFGRLVIAAVVDEHGHQMFSDEDCDLIQSKNLKTLQYVAEQILKFNGIGNDEEPEKN